MHQEVKKFFMLLIFDPVASLEYKTSMGKQPATFNLMDLPCYLTSTDTNNYNAAFANY